MSVSYTCRNIFSIKANIERLNVFKKVVFK